MAEIPNKNALAAYRAIGGGVAILPSVSIVVPAKNESRNLAHFFGTIPEWIDEVVLVDGHSTDNTVAEAQRLFPAVRIVHQPGHGKGDALQAGFEAAKGDIIVMMDADGSTDAAEIPRFVAALTTGADFAKGSRFASGGGSDDITFSRQFGNRILSTLVNVLFKTRYTDLCYGYNAFWAQHLDKLGLANCAGFEIETVMNVRAAKAGLAIQEIPSYEHLRLHGMSNLRVVRDGLRIGKFIVKEWLSDRGTAQQAMRTGTSTGRAQAPAVEVTDLPAPSLLGVKLAETD
jgi:glycosyltransferase involved in cell wall biosynthesis